MTDFEPPVSKPAEKRALSWLNQRTPSPSEVWVEANTSPGPLTQHFISLHALALHSGMDGQALQLFERHLQEMAAHTRLDPYLHPHLMGRIPR